MYYLVLVVAVAFQVQPPTGATEGILTVGQVLDRWEAGVELVVSYDLTVALRDSTFLKNENGKVTLTKEAFQFDPSFSRIYRKGVKRRGEFVRNEQGQYGITLIWDGSRGYSFQSRLVSVAPFISNFGNDENEDYEIFWRTFRGTIDRIPVSRRRKSKLLPREGRLYVVDVPDATTHDDPHYIGLRWRVWLDPDKNFLPVKIQEWIVKDGGDLHNLDTENELREVLPGVWAPVRITIRVFHKDKKSPLFGECMGISVLSVDMDQSKFNVDLPDDLFEAKIPTGTTVVDRGRNVVYAAGSENADAYLAQLAQDEKAKLKKLTPVERTPPQMVFIPDDDWPRWAKPLLIGAGVALFAIVFAIRVRARRAA